MSERVLGGRYTVQDRIGTGGMAIVYRGLDEVLGRTVAIKTMLPQYAADPSFAARFKQEAQAAAALQSPYIVSVYDWGKDGDTYYIVMEYLRGTDLKSGIRKHGALDSKKVAQIGSQIAQALSVAHKHDIIHRDIKPQNIMVQPDGNIKVMDFGIARAKNSHLTTDNSVLGTAHYVSPEQTQGKELGPTTDIYSLGIVMYEAATGRVPFDGDDAISVALKQVNEQPVPPTAINPAVDSALESIILKCMQKDPKDRFQTADELYHVLRDYLAGRLAAVDTATSVLPANPVVPAIGTIGSTGNTQSLPRVETAEHIRPQSATQRAQAEADAAAKKHKHRVVLFSILGIAALIAVIVGLVTLYNANNATREVPNYLSMTESDALKAISSSDFFKRGSVKRQYSSTVAKGLVIDQTPDSGRKVTKGTQISLVISKGPAPAETVKVPDLTGMSPSEAEKALSAVGLVGQAGDSVYSESVDVGKVAAQSPEGGTSAKTGDTVTYQLSKGKESVDVPSVTGQDENTATATLKAAGFNVDVKYGNSDSADKGTVYNQSPTGTANKGATITIYVSNGPSTVSVPNVVGSTAEDAEAALEAEGFKYSLTYQNSSSVAQGTVISQSSTSAKSGATITLVISNGPSTTTDSTNSNSNTNGNTSSSSNSGSTTGKSTTTTPSQ